MGYSNHERVSDAPLPFNINKGRKPIVDCTRALLYRNVGGNYELLPIAHPFKKIVVLLLQFDVDFLADEGDPTLYQI